MKKIKKTSKKRLLIDQKLVNQVDRKVEPIQRIESALSEDEIKQLINLADSHATKGEIESVSYNDISNIRRSKILWLPRNEFPEIYKKLWRVALAANLDFRFDISMFTDDIQVSYYDESEQGFFRWHTDIPYNRMIRKLSISVPLNSSTEYEGGEMMFNPHGEINTEHQKTGQAIIFPSFILHTVTPVTKGRRYSLVAWIGGLPFR